MGGGLLGSPLQRGIVRDRNSWAADCLSEEYRSSWYISRKEIENCSPSRKDGIDLKKESELRLWYCSFLKDIGMRLGVPQLTVATSIMFCHRFYLHQSHAKNEWQTVATVCMFLASKVEETPCSLDKVVKVAYETMYKSDPATARKIYQKDVFARQKALILIGEKVLLSTIRFDFNVQHPYRPLFDALKKFGITQEAVVQKAWKFVDDSLRTTLCLQYKPHYIAAGSIFLAAKLYNVRLPSERGYVWWNEFDVMPQQLNAAVQEMAELLGYKRRPPVARRIEKPIEIPLAAKNEALNSPDSCVLSRPDSSRSTTSQDFDGEAGRQGPVNCVVRDSGSNRGERSCVSSRTEPQCQPRDSESPTGIVEDRQGSGKGVEQVRTNPEHLADRLRTIDLDRIKGMMKRQKREREANKRTEPMDNSIGDAWIERELETYIEVTADSSKKLRLARGYEVKTIG